MPALEIEIFAMTAVHDCPGSSTLATRENVLCFDVWLRRDLPDGEIQVVEEMEDMSESEALAYAEQLARDNPGTEVPEITYA